MNKELNNYTIEDFIKIKPVIYEYCLNLSQKRTATSWFRHIDDANDLYQDVFLYVHNNYFNKSHPKMAEGKFIQIMKNCTYWAFYRQVNSRYSSNKIKNNLNHYQDSLVSEYLIQEKLSESMELFQNIQDHPDYNYIMKDLQIYERLAVHYFLKGYKASEIAKKLNKCYNTIHCIPKKIISKLNKDVVYNPSAKSVIQKKVEKIKPALSSDSEFVKSKVANFDKIFKKNEHIVLYSLYLQKLNHRNIAKKLNKSVSQINVEIFRINQKIKKLNNAI
jgi:DNA-directed RNA polymerase specialized sigma24 family protein